MGGRRVPNHTLNTVNSNLLLLTDELLLHILEVSSQLRVDAVQLVRLRAAQCCHFHLVRVQVKLFLPSRIRSNSSSERLLRLLFLRSSRPICLIRDLALLATLLMLRL